MNDAKTIGQNISRLRTIKGMSMRELSLAAKLSTSRRIEHIEQGTANIRVEELKKICDVFQVNIEAMLNRVVELNFVFVHKDHPLT